MTSLWRDFSGNDFANSNWICLLISVSKVYWRVQPTTAYARRSGRFDEMYGAVRALRIPLWELPEMIEKE